MSDILPSDEQKSTRPSPEDGVEPEVESLAAMEIGEPLREELARLSEGQQRFFRERLQRKLQSTSVDWNGDQVASFCAALGTLFAQLLWDADDECRASVEVILSDASDPHLRVFPLADSRLERRQGELRALELDSHEVAAYLAPQCHLSTTDAWKAWKVIARELDAATEALPQVEVRASPSGVRVHLREATRG